MLALIPALSLLLWAGLHASSALAQTAAATARVRGIVLSVSAERMSLRDRRGETVELMLSDKLVVNEVFPISLDDIKPGSYIGTAALPQADGSLRAIAVSVFAESSRGVGEGHRPFDLLPQSTMTNGNVAGVMVARDGSAGRTLLLKYKDGEKTIVVPAEAPIVSSRPADRSLLVSGASVSLTAQLVDGKPTVLRLNAGRNGFVLPY